MTGALTRRASLMGALGAVGAWCVAGVAPLTATKGGGGGLYVLGDSWAAGLHADASKALGQIAAQILGTRVVVDAVSGTGYLNAAGAADYLQRAQQAAGSPRLVIVQGGSNDQHLDLSAVAANARSTYQVLRGRFPAAQLLVLGPGPDPEPVTARQWEVDTTLEAAAHALDVNYVSMLRSGWIPSRLADSVIDPTTHHPTTAGQAYLGTRLAAAARLHYPTLFG